MDQPEAFPKEVQSGLRVSLISCAWTLAAGSSAIAVGLAKHSVALVAFGAIGLVDAVGSGSLTVHFRHALRHEAISERHERTAHWLVTLGMATVGTATIGGSAYRLATKPSAESEVPGIVLAAVSVIVLAALARRKRTLAERIPSPVLDADGWLSATGAVLAVVVLAGTGLQAGLGWWWMDPVAAVGVGAGAVSLAIALIPRT